MFNIVYCAVCERPLSVEDEDYDICTDCWLDQVSEDDLLRFYDDPWYEEDEYEDF